MGSGIYFPLLALLFSLLLVCLIFFKKHIKTVETKLYSFLVLSNFFGLIVELLCTYASYIHGTNLLLSNFILKLYLFFITLWVYLFTFYIIYISVDNKKIDMKKMRNYGIVVFLIISILIFILPINLVIKDDFATRYTEGLSVYFTYGVSSILILVMLIFIVKNIKNLNSKRYLPLLAFLIVGSAAMTLQMFNPSMLLVTYMETFITSLMYHTIENPDLKVIEELKKNRSLTNKTYIEKSNFLFRMSAEVRKPIDNIKELNDSNLDSNDIKEIKENSLDIDLNLRNVNFTINNVLDVTDLDTKNINIVNNKYSIIKLLNEIKLRESKKINNIRFDFNISDSIPEYLYGDSIRLKNILMCILDKAIERTNNGFIEVNVNSINKYDICRLIITIEDSSTPLSLDEINKILSNDNELDENNITIYDVNKIVNMMNGNLMVKSEEGNEFLLSIDSKIVDNTKKEEITNDTDILFISNDTKLLKQLEKLFNEYTSNSVLNGLDAIDLIKAGENYNLILIDDVMKPISGLEVLKKLRSLDINIPCIVMLEKDKDHIKNHYIKDGFIDYIMKDDISNINKTIKKYL